MKKSIRKYSHRPHRGLGPLILPAAILIFLLILTDGTLSAGDELSLDRALNIAFQNSPAMRQVSLQLEVNEQNLKAQQAGLKSRFSLNVTPYRTSSDRVFSDLTSDYNTQTQTRSETTFRVVQPVKWTDGTLTLTDRFNWQKASSSFAGGTEQSSFSNSLTVSFNQPLFTYNRTKMQIKELELALENAQLAYAIQKLQIERQVTQQFLNLYYSRRSIQISDEEYKNASESLSIIESKVDAGITAREELYQAEVTKDNSLASLENQKMQHQNNLDTFKILLGLELEDLIDVSADIQKKMVEVDLSLAIAHGLGNRLELRQKDIEIQTAMHSLIEAAATNEFKANLNLSFGLTGTNPKLPGVYDSPNTDRLVALTLDIPLFDWGQKKHHMAATMAQVETVKLSAEEEEKSIKLEIREAYRNLQNQARQIEIAEKSIKNAELTYEINLERYRNGDLTSKDLQFYQLQLSTQKLNLVQALINYKLALLDLKIRTLWDFENNRSIMDSLIHKMEQED